MTAFVFFYFRTRSHPCASKSGLLALLRCVIIPECRRRCDCVSQIESLPHGNTQPFIFLSGIPFSFTRAPSSMLTAPAHLSLAHHHASSQLDPEGTREQPALNYPACPIQALNTLPEWGIAMLMMSHPARPCAQGMGTTAFAIPGQNSVQG